MIRDRLQIKQTDSNNRVLQMTCIFVCLSWLVYSTNKLARIQTRTQRKPCTAVRSCCFMGQFAQWNLNGTGKDGIDHYCHRRPMSNGRTWRRQTWWVTWIQNGVHVYTLWFIFGRNWIVTAALSRWYCRDDFNVKTNTVMSILEAPYLIEAPQTGPPFVPK